MAVSLHANALLDPADAQVAKFLKLPVNSDELITLINRASAECEGYCNRPLKAQDYVSRLPGQRGPALRPLPTPIDIDLPVTLVFGGLPLTVWKRESDGDPAGKDVIVGADVPGAPSFFYRAAGWVGSTPVPGARHVHGRAGAHPG